MAGDYSHCSASGSGRGRRGSPARSADAGRCRCGRSPRATRARTGPAPRRGEPLASGAAAISVSASPDEHQQPASRCCGARATESNGWRISSRHRQPRIDLARDVERAREGRGEHHAARRARGRHLHGDTGAEAAAVQRDARGVDVGAARGPVEDLDARRRPAPSRRACRRSRRSRGSSRAAPRARRRSRGASAAYAVTSSALPPK